MTSRKMKADRKFRNFRKRYRKRFYIDTVPVKIYINQKIR